MGMDMEDMLAGMVWMSLQFGGDDEAMKRWATSGGQLASMFGNLNLVCSSSRILFWVHPSHSQHWANTDSGRFSRFTSPSTTRVQIGVRVSTKYSSLK